MSERYWYIKEGKKSGPLTKERLTQLLQEEEISRDTLVWTEEMDGWEPLDSIKGFEPGELSSQLPGDKKDISNDPIARPWRRLLGRGIDYNLLGFFLGIITGMGGVHLEYWNGIFVTLTLFFVWIFIEAALLSTWGYTPGKWLMQTRVRGSKGEILTYHRALVRSFSVWCLGMGAGLPFVSLITMLIAGITLSKKKRTAWDKPGQITVYHDKIGIWRILFIVSIFLIFAILFVVDAMTVK